MYQLEEPFYFYLLLIVPILTIGFFILISWKKAIQKEHISNHLFKKLSPESSKFKPKSHYAEDDDNSGGGYTY